MKANFLLYLLFFLVSNTSIFAQIPTKIFLLEDNKRINIEEGYLLLHDSLLVVHDSLPIVNNNTSICLPRIPKRGRCVISLILNEKKYKFQYFFEAFYIKGKKLYITFEIDNYPSIDNYPVEEYGILEFDDIKSINRCSIDSDKIEGFMVEIPIYIDSR